MRRVLSLIALVACGGPQVATPPKANLTKSLPATLEATQPKTGDPRPVHVRVWADTGVRALPHWKDEITDQLDYAGQLLTPLLGIRITVDSIKDWDHAGTDPRTALAALAKTDDGKDVTWVIGYITPGDAATSVMADLGAAEVLGHYVTVRGWADKPETDKLAAKLPDLDPSQRTETIAAHKRHKQAVVLLHGLAQTLGAIAEAEPTKIQNPGYSSKQSSFSERDRELMQLSIDARLGAGTDQTIAHDLIEAIDKNQWGGWVQTDHDEVLASLRNIVDSAKAGKTAADVPAVVYAQFDRVRELLKRGELDEARIELDNILSAYPGNAAMYELKCEIMLARPAAAPAPKPPIKAVPSPREPGHVAPPPPPQAPPKPLVPAAPDKATRAACARASELAPGDPAPHLAVGEAFVRVNDFVSARGELVQAGAKIANLPIGQPEAWKRLVGIYQSMGALTWTEEALTAAKLDNDPIAAEVAQLRARFGVRRGATYVKPEAEGALVAAVRGALDLVYASKYADAERAIAAGEKKWPGAPGFAATRCDLALRQGEVDVARAACARAIAADPDESWALYLGGVIALKDTSAGGTKAGIEKLKHAIAVDPELGQAWRALGKAYDRAKDQAAHDELAKQYQAKFNQSLP